MIADIASRRDELRDLCRRFQVRRLDVFGSAAREAEFDPARSDIDFLVEFAAEQDEFARFIRKRHILAGAVPIYATFAPPPTHHQNVV